MRIALVSGHASPLAALDGVDVGGQNVHVAALATELGAAGHRVTVYTRRDDPTRPVRVPLAPGVVVEHVRAGPLRPIPKDELVPYMDAFGDHLAWRWKESPPDVAHAHFWMSGLAVRHAVRSVSVPTVLTYHALGSVKRRHQGERDTSPPSRVPAEANLGRGTDAIIATSAEEVTELRGLGVPPSLISVVPCGVDPHRFHPDGPKAARGSAPLLLGVGRLVPRKGFDTVIRALPLLPDAELVIAGGPQVGELPDDPEAARLQKVAWDCGVVDRVTLLGGLPGEEVPPLMRAADAVVCVPWYEPFGMVAVEAMACGAPVVASVVGGQLDTVMDGVTGIHVAPHATAELAARLDRLIRDPALRRRLGRRATRRARARYAWPRIAEETVNVYRQTLRRATAPAAELPLEAA
jgi:glycosyltransferase involved in cell wall biosynthesis